MKELIRIRGVSKTYGHGDRRVYALRDVNLDVHRGEFLALVGPSGSGKSSLLNLLSLIDEPCTGTIAYGGTVTAALTDNELTTFRNRRIGIVFQAYNLIPVLTATENVAFALEAQGVARREAASRAGELLAELGLGNHLGRRPEALSGGQQQRVAIARALITRPEIVIADEPTAALDGRTGMEIISLMEELNRRYGTTFIFSTHDHRVIDRLTNLVEIEDGRIAGGVQIPYS